MMSYGEASSYSNHATEEMLTSSPVRLHTFSDWLKHHVFLASLIVLICSLAPRLFFTLHADPQNLMFQDSTTYLNPAKNLLESGSFYKSPIDLKFLVLLPTRLF